METANTKTVALVADAINGEHYAFRQLYEQYSTLMFNISIRMVGARDEAEDIVQESFISAFRNLGQLKDKGSFGAWLRRIVVNECIKRSGRTMQFGELPADDQTPETGPSDWISQDNYEQLHEAIKGLPSGCRQVFLLYASEEYSHREIAALLNISESTSKSQYARAKKLLKNALTAGNG